LGGFTVSLNFVLESVGEHLLGALSGDLVEVEGKLL
jgi:hypothetical protein